MSTIQQLDQLVEIAQQLGYQVRHDYFGGTGGGLCEIAGNKWLFIDLALNSSDQLEKLKDILGDDPLLSTVKIDHDLEHVLDRRVA